MAKKRVTLVKDFEEILERGDIEECKRVFDKCDINAKTNLFRTNAFGCNPLSREFALWLKAQGCDIEFRDEHGETPIFHHITHNHDDFDLMIELGADIFAKDKRGLTLLHTTASYCNLNAIKKLLNNGFDINTKCDKTFYFLVQYTPLEYALDYGNLFPPDMLRITEFMIENGALITDEIKKIVVKKGTEFEFGRDIFSDNTLKSFDEAYQKLFKIIDVKRPEQLKKHDGISDIIVSETDFAEAYNKLWEYLVPGSGRAKSAQGECIRLVGRLSYELIDNGGINWCKDFKLMANTLGEYLKSGYPLVSEKLLNAERIIKYINRQTCDDDIALLSEYAVEWIRQNPKVLPLIEAEYIR